VDAEIPEVLNIKLPVVRLNDWELEEGESPYTVVVWNIDQGQPFDNYDEANEAFGLTTEALAQLMGEDVESLDPEGWDNDELVYVIDALTDGMSEIRDALPQLAEMEEAVETIGGVFDALLLAGLKFTPETESAD